MYIVCVEELCGLLADLAAGDCLVLMQCSPHMGPWPYMYMYMWACPMYFGGGGGGGHSICGSSLHLSLCAYACVFLCEHACMCICLYAYVCVPRRHCHYHNIVHRFSSSISHRWAVCPQEKTSNSFSARPKSTTQSSSSTSVRPSLRPERRGVTMSTCF